MQPVCSSRPSFRDPVWLLFIPPLFGRCWLLWQSALFASWLSLSGSLLIMLLLASITWRIAASLASVAQLSERGTERLTVMSTLGALAPPLFFVPAETISSPQHNVWLLLIFPLTPNSLAPLALDIARTSILMINAVSILYAIGNCFVSIWHTNTVMQRVHCLTALPLSYSGGIILLSLVAFILHIPMFVQYYMLSLLVLALPFFTAALFATPYMLTQWQAEQHKTTPARNAVPLHICMLALIAIYFVSQLYTYIATNLTK